MPCLGLCWISLFFFTRQNTLLSTTAPSDLPVRLILVLVMPRKQHKTDIDKYAITPKSPHD